MKRPIVYQAHEKSYQYKYKDHFRNPESLYSGFSKVVISVWPHANIIGNNEAFNIEHDLGARQ